MNDLNRKMIKFAAWGGIFFMVFTLGGFATAGFLPPHRPLMGAAEIAEIHRADYFRIRLGMVFVMMAGAGVMFFGAGLAALIRKIEEGSGVLSMVTLLGGYGLALLNYIPAMWWLILSYRPERDEALIHLFNDAGWVQFIGGLFIAWPLMITLTIVPFVDKQETPYFPRWYGYLTAWLAVATLPGQLIFFLQSGPFAWDGFFAFYFPLSLFTIWLALTVVLMIKAANRPA